MNAVITVIGADKVGILAKVSGVCAEYNVNIEEVTQNILGEVFAMIMIVDVANSTVPFTALSEKLAAAGREIGTDIRITRQELFDAMHRI
ncbi:MAG: ACT domain-containing protein [Oscillospiraceae bacterium]|nr:ACT domain-containing protein [Oscillospiraceae bacterium]